MTTCLFLVSLEAFSWKKKSIFLKSVVNNPSVDSCCNSEKGLFSQCLHNMVAGGIAKAYLTSHLGGKVNVKLNDGQCEAQEQDVFYYFRSSQKSSKCGTKRLVSYLSHWLSIFISGISPCLLSLLMSRSTKPTLSSRTFCLSP